MSTDSYTHLDREDLIWLAGLLEGEGTFDSHRGRYPRIRLGMCDRDVVGRAATLMGSSIRMTIYPDPKTSTTFHTEISGTRAAELMRRLLPYMGARRSAKIGDVLGAYAAWQKTDAASMPGPTLTRPPGFGEITKNPFKNIPAV